jgi:hypothetical protein
VRNVYYEEKMDIPGSEVKKIEAKRVSISMKRRVAS